MSNTLRRATGSICHFHVCACVPRSGHATTSHDSSDTAPLLPLLEAYIRASGISQSRKICKSRPRLNFTCMCAPNDRSPKRIMSCSMMPLLQEPSLAVYNTLRYTIHALRFASTIPWPGLPRLRLFLDPPDSVGSPGVCASPIRPVRRPFTPYHTGINGTTAHTAAASARVETDGMAMTDIASIQRSM